MKPLFAHFFYVLQQNVVDNETVEKEQPKQRADLPLFLVAFSDLSPCRPNLGKKAKGDSEE